MYFSARRRSATFYWEAIECTERNGNITGYAVRILPEGGGDIVHGLAETRAFNASGLTPGSRYSFQVAGFNIIGTGPYTDATYLTTTEDGMVLKQYCHMHGLAWTHAQWGAVQ